MRCACWALLNNAGSNEDTVRRTVHDRWIPGLQRITGPWTVQGDPKALRCLQTGGALVIANHQSMIDIPLLMSACGPVPRFTAKASIRHWPFLGVLLSATGTCFIDRCHPRASHDAMMEWGKTAAVKPSTLIAGFPEGTRSKDGKLRAFKSGLFRTAAAAQLPIVVVILDPMAMSAHAACVIEPNADAKLLRTRARKAFEEHTLLAGLN
jgi:1-acyl-sn-glycerol-3-phosphate acyltransferase